ncbi:MAG: adenylate/guanylate cyclase domain-containing protein [Anaerolineales bacterium]|nr:adenylate/guanylate cyclase domain-containing protein [Anaerolineales bacterium]
MEDEIGGLISAPLDLQLMNLSKSADEVLETLETSRASTPQVLDQIQILAGRLARISRQVARLEEERQDLSALADISHIVNSSLKLDSVLRIVMDTIVRLTGAERGFLMLKDKSGDLGIWVARNWEQESIEDPEQSISRTVIDRVVESGEAILTTNAQEDPRFGGKNSIVAYSLRSILCVPLLNRNGDLSGVIYADNRIRSGIFTEAERKLLLAFGNQASVAIENARLFESIRQTLDEVTELKNLMEDVFSSILSGVITADVNNQITLCNRAAETILGEPAEGLIGKPIEALLASISPELVKHLGGVHQGNEKYAGLEFHPTLPGKEPQVLLVSLSPLKDAERATQGVTVVLEDMTEQKRLEAMRGLFERMVSPAVIEQLDPEKLQLGGSRATITTLFADLRGFTGFSETIPPEELVSILNLYLGAATEAILSQQGTLDKFMGDAVMAFFNAPIPQAEHTLRAVRSALKIRESLGTLHAELPASLHLSFGVGIHYGDAVLGLVGSEERLDYTAVGDSVNTAKRIQENSEPGQILISAEAFDRLGDKVDVRPVPTIMPKGKTQPVEVYEILGLR